MHSGHIPRRWNEDILAEIFGHLQAEIIDAPTASSATRRTLDPQSTSGSRNGTSEEHHGEYDLALIALARCARASRVLHEPAINALWNTVHSISHLTGVLACASKYRDQQDVNTHILMPVDEISPAAFERFQYYARRLRARFGEQPLLPKLAMLNWAFSPQAPDPSEILPLVSPSLRTLLLTALTATESGYSLTAFDPVKHALKADPSTFMRQLSAAAPRLEYFSLRGTIPRAVLTHVGDLTQLRSVNLSMYVDPLTPGIGFSLDDPVFRALAVLPKLQTLNVTLKADPGGSSTSPPVRQSRTQTPALMEFPSLHGLSAISGSLSPIQVVLTRISSPEFHSLSIATTLKVHWPDFYTTLSTAAKRFPTTLRVVRVRLSLLTVGSSSQADHAVQMGEFFAPLLAVRGLEEFLVEICNGANAGNAPALNPTEALKFARAWPRLQVLALLCPCTPSGFPAEVLTTLAKHCPALETLHLASLDLSSVAACKLSSLPVSDHRLQQLYLGGDIPGKDSTYTTPVAQVVDKIFPYTNIRPFSRQKLAPCEHRTWHEFRKCVKQVRRERMGFTHDKQ
ncbi:hypothetical protein C8Q70DRAFT_930000 [Cubamyces menziesii]|nr:hypothetical protein C8Q70DRAFT_930000 [Cubamyces menziesii]